MHFRVAVNLLQAGLQLLWLALPNLQGAVGGNVRVDWVMMLAVEANQADQAKEVR